MRRLKPRPIRTARPGRPPPTVGAWPTLACSAVVALIAAVGTLPKLQSEPYQTAAPVAPPDRLSRLLLSAGVAAELRGSTDID